MIRIRRVNRCHPDSGDQPFGAVEQCVNVARAPQPPVVQRQPLPEIVAGVRISWGEAARPRQEPPPPPRNGCASCATEPGASRRPGRSRHRRASASSAPRSGSPARFAARAPWIARSADSAAPASSRSRAALRASSEPNAIPALEDLYQLQPEAPRSERRQPRADRLAVQRMRQPDLVAVRRDQPVRLGLEQRVLGRQPADLLQRERLAEREQFDRMPVIGGQAVHPLIDELDQRRTRGRAALESPEPGCPDERAGLDGAADQLAHVEHVSPADLGHPVKRGLLHGVAERGLDERPDRTVTEVGELHSPGGVVLPQRDDGVRARLAGADGRDDERRRRGRQMKNERRRDRVEQLRIVDAEDHRAAPGARTQLLAAASRSAPRRHRSGPRRAPDRLRPRGERPPRCASPEPSRRTRRRAQRHPAPHAPDATSRPRRSAITTTPWQPGSARADAIASSSRSRPTSGHAPVSADACPGSPGIATTKSTPSVRALS